MYLVYFLAHPRRLEREGFGGRKKPIYAQLRTLLWAMGLWILPFEIINLNNGKGCDFQFVNVGILKVNLSFKNICNRMNILLLFNIYFKNTRPRFFLIFGNFIYFFYIFFFAFLFYAPIKCYLTGLCHSLIFLPTKNSKL